MLSHLHVCCNWRRELMPRCFKYKKVSIPKCWMQIVVDTYDQMFRCKKITIPKCWYPTIMSKNGTKHFMRSTKVINCWCESPSIEKILHTISKNWCVQSYMYYLFSSVNLEGAPWYNSAVVSPNLIPIYYLQYGHPNCVKPFVVNSVFWKLLKWMQNEI